MYIVKISGKSGMMELADLASLLLPASAVRKERDELNGSEFGEDCEGCEEDEDECVLCNLRSILHETDLNGKARQENVLSRRHKTGSGWQAFPFRFWAKLTTSRDMVEQ